MSKNKKLKVARLGVGGQSPGPKGQRGGSNTTAPGGGGDGPSEIGPVVKDVPFKKPLSTAASALISTAIPFAGAAINYGAKQNYKNRQKFSKKEGLYRDFYKTTGKTLQPNSTTGKKYTKDAGFNKKTTTTIDRGGEKLLPKPSPVSSVNEPLSGYKKPTVEDGVFNYTVGYSKGGMLRQGKPKLAKKGWK